MTGAGAAIPVTVRFFAAARAAAGTESDVLRLPPGSTVADAIGELAGRNGHLARVLERCSYLCDGVSVRDRAARLHPHQILDVLPPFSGG